MGIAAIQTLWYSIVDSAAYFFGQSAANVRSQSGSFSVGNKFSSTKALIVTGVRFFWKSPGSAKTIKVTLWEKSVAVATANVSVNASGVYTGTFTPFTLAAFQDYAVTMWENSGGNYTDMLSDGSSAPFFAVPIVGQLTISAFAIVRSFSRFAAGDAVPSSTTASNGAVFPVEPVFAAYNLIDGAAV